MTSYPAVPPLGATLTSAGVAFCVWAPERRQVIVAVEGGPAAPLRPLPGGYHGGVVPGLRPGARYQYLLDGDGPFPDPCSRSQPDGPHGPSAVVDPAAFPWTDAAWPGLRREGLVIYELHTGAFTEEGTFDAIIPDLARLRDLGVTAIELMPVAAFPGRWNWGYDGVSLFAPSATYGGPDGLRRLVDAAHATGLGVILDAVYNHLGPDGNYTGAFSPHYTTNRHHTPWGDALNFDGPHSRPVRDFVCAAAVHWITEYHLDGLRLDAVHAIFDRSTPHILRELTERTRAAAAFRSIVVIAESEENDVRLIRSTPGGYGLDGVWADDFHHAVRVRLTGEREGYYSGFAGTAAEIARAVAEGFIYQGQATPEGTPRGTTVTDEPAAAFVFCIQNHDQVGNRAEGEPLAALISRDAFAATSALLLLAPETPLLWMGQEYGATTPFLYFTDHAEELGKLVTQGRREEFAAFSAFHDPARRARIPDPQAEATFRRSKLEREERARNVPLEGLYRDLLTLRRDDAVLRRQDRATLRVCAPTDGAVAIRFGAGSETRRLLLANLGPAAFVPWPDQDRGPWRTLLWTGDIRYGGSGGEPPSAAAGGIALPEFTAVLLGTG